MAQEDDAERAVRAAIELVDSVYELGQEIGVPELALRAGVLTGETSVGPGGNATGLVLGDVVNTASRLQSIAAPGTVAVGETTVRLTEGAIDYAPLGEQELKGKSVPVSAWRALRVSAARGGRGRSEGLEPPFVGRQDEMRILKDALDATARESRGRLISIVGEGGIGKTRLGTEFWKYIDGLVDDIYWHQGRSPSYGQGLTFWALGEMVRQRAGIAETDDEHKSRTRLRTAVAEYVPDVDEQRWIEPRLAGLLGLDEMPEGDRMELYAALSTFFQRISERGTTVLLFEDLHWADPGLLAFIDELVERAHRNPILVITLARPELIEREPSWGAARKNTLSTHLGHLADVDVRELIRGVVPDMSDESAGRIVARASGVPLYAVEMLRMLHAQGDIVEADGGGYRMSGEVQTLAIPETLQAVIGARIDRLSATDREVLQDAAVLGLSFTVDSLAALTGDEPDRLHDRLQPLVRRELLHLERDPRSPERGQYRFVQSLIREVTYGRLTHAERRARHLKVAGYFEQRGGAETSSVVANHYMAAYHAAPEGSEAEALAAKATAALRGAARRAADLHSSRQVLDLCREALALGAGSPIEGEILELAADAANALLEEELALDYAKRAVEWYAAHGDDADRIRATTLLGSVYTDFFHPGHAISVLRPYYEEHPDPQTPEELRLGSALVRALMLNGDHEEVMSVSDTMLPRAERDEDALVIVETLNTRGTSLANFGRIQEGIALLKRALELAEQNDLPMPAMRARNNLGVLAIMDDGRSTYENAKSMYQAAVTLGDPSYLVRTTVAYSVNLIDNGEFDAALRVMDDLEYGGDSTFARWIEWGRARVMAARGLPDAEKAARDAIERMRAYEDEPQQMYLNDSIAAFVEATFHRPAEAFEMAMAARHPFGYPWHLLAATRAAVALRDPSRLARVDSALRELAQRGRRITTLSKLVTGGVAVLQGEKEEGKTTLHEFLAMQAKVDLALARAEGKAQVAQVLGLDDPDGLKAARDFVAWCAQVGAPGLLDQYSDIAIAEDSVEAAAG